MVEINPMRIPGRWRFGWVLDYHTISSTYIGDDEFGHAQFDTVRSEIGELLFRLKYRSDRTAVVEIADAVANFIKERNPSLSMIVPVPPSRPRAFQPVLLLAQEVSNRLRIPLELNAVVTIGEVSEIKNVYQYEDRLKLLERAFEINEPTVAGQNILLLDDLFRSGATMNSITEALYQRGRVAEVYVIAVTRTRSLT